MNKDKEDAVRGFIAVYDGDATQALLDLARVGGIAVNYIDRPTIEAGWGRDLTDEEWSVVRPHLEDYDAWLDNSGALESIQAWRDQVLPDLAGIPLAGEEEDDDASPAAPVDERVALTFAARASHPTTVWLEITYPVDAVPETLLADLQAIGFGQDNLVALPPVRAYRHDESGTVDLGYHETTVHLSKPGTDLLLGWTETERTENMRAARAVLRRYGFTRVPVWHKRLEDML